MNANDQSNGQHDRPLVVVHAPLEADRKILVRLLSEQELETRSSSDNAQLAAVLDEGRQLDCLVSSQEGLTNGSLSLLNKVLAEQPTWSELPIILLVDDPFQSKEIGPWLHARLPRSKLCILQRPVRRTEFASIVRSLIAGRKHQFSVRDHIAFQDELRRELNHRIKNILTTAVSLFELSRRNTSEVDTLARDYRGRLLALSDVHAALYEAQDEHIGVKALLARVFEPFAEEGRFSIDGPELLVDATIAETLALSFHELLTNAVKYGALAHPEGRVRIETSMVPEEPTRAKIKWTETGGAPVVEPEHRGYGTRFIESALKSRGGLAELRFPRSGLEAELVFWAQPGK